MTLLDYKLCDGVTKQELEKKSEKLVKICFRPIFIFRELADYLRKKKTVILGYSTMQDLIGQTLKREEERLENRAKNKIPRWAKDSLDDLLTNRSTFYDLTLIKKEPKGFNYQEIRKEVGKKNLIAPLYYLGVKILPELLISNENVKYYASLVEQQTIYKLKRRKNEITLIYLLCFIVIHFKKINDNVILSFIHYVSKYKDLAKKFAKEEIYKIKVSNNENLRKADQMIQFYADDTISNDSTVGELRQRVFSILEKELFPMLSKCLRGIAFDETEYEWQYYSKISKTVRKNLRYVFRTINFRSRTQTPLVISIGFLRDILINKKQIKRLKDYRSPKKLIKPKLKRYFYEDVAEITKNKNVDVNKLEFLIYLLSKNGLEAYDLFVKDSIQFLSFEDDLVDDDVWSNKELLIKDLDFPYLHKDIDDILYSLENELNQKLETVNKRIQKGQNRHIKTEKVGNKIKWRLPYDRIDPVGNHSFYNRFPQTELVDIFAFVDKKVDFLSCFAHFSGRHFNSDIRAITAAIISFATNNGLTKMSSMSDISYRTLLSAASNFIRPETLKNANDQIANRISQLAIFPYYNLQNTIHASSDGQKYGTKIPTINARYSPKYFGLNKGIVNYTLFANHVPINAKIIGANEHESHFVFDLLFNNTSDIQPEAVSVDRHGRNHVNAAILHIFGYVFAPRYNELNHDSNVIYSFKNPSFYKNCPIKPVRKVKPLLVKEEWDNVRRIMVSLALKKTTQSIIIKKLSSTKRKSRTKKALWEYNNIISSLYALDYIDDIMLRQRVQASINREDTYHQLCRAIFYANHGKFWVKTELEQNIWSECTRLIANVIIFYNAYILSTLLAKHEKDKNFEQANFLKKISPVAWRHINLYGKYEFRNKGREMDLDSLIKKNMDV